jgi:MFS family permease
VLRVTEPGTTTDPDASGIWRPRYLAVTLSNLTVVAIAAFDGLAIVAALAGIGEDLGRLDLLPWVLTAYLATSAVAVIVAGPIIDAIGVRRTFRVTGAWFLVWSAGAALAPSMPFLIAARALQGIGGGLVIAVALSAVGLTYPHELRPRAFAANSMVWGGMGFGGPAIAGALLAVGDWRAIFLAQLPITALALALGWNALPSTRDAPARIDIDWTGVGWLSLLTIASLVGVSEIGDRWLVAAAGLLVAVGAGAAYWRHSVRAAVPVLERQHLRRPPLWIAHVLASIVLIAGLGVDNYLPVYLQVSRGRSESFAAFGLVFLTVGWTLGSIVYSRLLTGLRELAVMRIGSISMVGACAASGVAVGADLALVLVFAAFFWIGVSIGLVSTAGLTLIQSASDGDEMGRTNAAHQFVRTLAITYGVAAGGAVVLLVVGRRVGDLELVRDVLAGEETDVGAVAAAAVGDGLTWVAVLSTAVAVIGAAIAVRAARQ